MTPTLEAIWNEFAVKLGRFIRARVSDPARAEEIRRQLKEMLFGCCQFEFERHGGVIECQPRAKGSGVECGDDKWWLYASASRS